MHEPVNTLDFWVQVDKQSDRAKVAAGCRMISRYFNGVVGMGEVDGWMVCTVQ